MKLSPNAETVLHKIIVLRKYPAPQSTIMEQRLLKTLRAVDFCNVVLALEAAAPADKSVSNG